MKKIFIVSLAVIIVVLGLAFLKKMRGPSLSPVEEKPVQQTSTAPFTIGPGDYNFSLAHGGLTRIYKVHAPPRYDKKVSTPVILIMHGGGGNVKSMRLLTLLDATSDKEGFIVVYPEGTGPKVSGKTIGSWNAGRCCPTAMRENVDDVGFISRMIDELQRNFNIDPARIYVTGHSNGAQMSFRLACELSEKIAAIAPIGATGVFDQCAPKRPVPVIYFFGTADPCVPYGGGIAGGCFQKVIDELLGTKGEPYTWQSDSVMAYAEKWVKWNGASGGPKITYQNKNATCRTWGENSNGEVVLCTIEGMGHVWPGGSYGDPCKIETSRFCRIFKETSGHLSNDIMANDAMWEFFKKHSIK